MGRPAAKQNDTVTATDIHIVQIPTPAGPVPTPLPHPFAGRLDGSLSSDVNVQGQPAAVQGSTATNQPSHVPQGGPFQSPPSNRATIRAGSATVLVNGKPMARSGDTTTTCNDPTDLPVATLVATSQVMVGG